MDGRGYRATNHYSTSFNGGDLPAGADARTSRDVFGLDGGQVARVRSQTGTENLFQVGEYKKDNFLNNMQHFLTSLSLANLPEGTGEMIGYLTRLREDSLKSAILGAMLPLMYIPESATTFTTNKMKIPLQLFTSVPETSVPLTFGFHGESSEFALTNFGQKLQASLLLLYQADGARIFQALQASVSNNAIHTIFESAIRALTNSRNIFFINPNSNSIISPSSLQKNSMSNTQWVDFVKNQANVFAFVHKEDEDLAYVVGKIKTAMIAEGQEPEFLLTTQALVDSMRFRNSIYLIGGPGATPDNWEKGPMTIYAGLKLIPVAPSQIKRAETGDSIPRFENQVDKPNHNVMAYRGNTSRFSIYSADSDSMSIPWTGAQLPYEANLVRKLTDPVTGEHVVEIGIVLNIFLDEMNVKYANFGEYLDANPTVLEYLISDLERYMDQHQ